MKNKYSYGGGDSSKINPLFKDIKEYNKYLLSLIGIFVLLLTGIISYNYTNTSYAKWSSSVESKNIIKLHVKSNLDESGANEPKITSNMIPVYYDETNSVWRKADVKNSKEQYKWYDYNNKMWANSVTTFPYEEKVTDTIKKNINVMPYSLTSESSSSVNTAVNSQYKMSFTTTKASIFSFDYSMLKGTKTSKFQVTINGTTEVNKDFSGNYSDTVFGETYTDSFSKNLEANKEYTVIINAEVTSSNASADNSITVSNINLTNEYTNFSYENSGSKFTVRYYLSHSYALDQVTGKYVLDLIHTSSEYLKDGYICPNTTSNICDEIYKIVDITYGYMWSAEVTDATINSYVSYTSKNIENDFSKKEIGEEIPLDKISTMWVWIPRYTYTYLDTNTPQEISIKFEKGTSSSGTIKCVDNVTYTGTTSETCTDTTNSSLKTGISTYTHPAFWWDKNDNNVRETGEELTGIWVGKFEVSSDASCTASYEVAVGSGCNLQSIRPLIKPNVTSWRGAQVGTFFNGIYKMREAGNKYGFATTDETHMMKNMEWGAVTYLSHSKYGINKEVAINSANTYTTGCGPQSEGTTSGGATCNSYTTALGQSASTTGNVYGVYDMSGGAYEYMMGNIVYSDGKVMSGRTTSYNYNSAFTGILNDGGETTFTGTYSFPSKRYYDKYSYGTSNTEYTRGKLGDATKEMAPTGIKGNWYSGRAYFPSSYNPWFVRGGRYDDGVNAGALGFGHSTGGSTDFSARAVLSVIN